MERELDILLRAIPIVISLVALYISWRTSSSVYRENKPSLKIVQKPLD